MKILLPIITFVFGYCLSLVEKYIERRRCVRNLRAVLLLELRRNYSALVKIAGDNGLEMPHTSLLKFAAERLSTKMFDSYLDRLDILRPLELESILNAYESIQETIGFSKLETDRDGKALDDSEALLLLTFARLSYIRLEKAIRQFDVGIEILKALEDKRGEMLKPFRGVHEKDRQREKR